ncbi:MAG TPA: FAD-dependent oxidoreductase [Gaiellaceae bacterium]|jgi:sarcosine oxidase subunit beta|nr:FAD-dependent oxidoreductase [Gaiellaceae bacterium]
MTRCAVVGAGIVGLAIARELRARGAEVVVLERSGIGAGASGVQPGGVRQQWGTPVACRLARESVSFWRTADERLTSRVPLTLRRSGYLFVARSDATLARLAENVRVQNEEGIPSIVVSPRQAAELVPGLRDDAIAGGAWCAEDGYFDRPQAVVEAFADGLEIRHEEVRSVRRDGDGWTVAGSGFDAVVVAAGFESRTLLQPLGVDLPVTAEDRYLFLSDPIEERLLEPLVVAPELAFAAKHLADGRMLASDLAARGDPEHGRDRWRATIRAGVDELLPRLEYVSFSLLVRGVYDVTPDHQPILGEVADGLHVACGFSGHGFMIAPAVGRIVAGAVLREHDDVLDVLGVDRFASGRLVPEPQLV